MRSHTPVAGPTRFLSAVEQLLQLMIKAVSLNVLHQQRVSSPSTPTLETAEYSSCALMESLGTPLMHKKNILQSPSTPTLETAEYSSCALMESQGSRNVRLARCLIPGLETVLTGSVLNSKQSLNVLLIMLQLMVCDPSNKIRAISVLGTNKYFMNKK